MFLTRSSDGCASAIGTKINHISSVVDSEFKMWFENCCNHVLLWMGFYLQVVVMLAETVLVAWLY